MKLKLLALSTMVACSAPALAEVELYKDDKTTINFAGDLTANMVSGDDSNGDSYTEIKDGFNRIYFSLNSEMKDGWAAVAKLEWKVRLTENDSDLVLRPGEDNVALGSDDADQSLSNRLGFVGVAHDKWGSFTIGKQWGSSYMATGATDSFMIYGGEGLGIFDLGDGGFTGVGRAEKSLQYNNQFGNLKISAQVQASNKDIEIDIPGVVGAEVELDGSAGFGASYAIGEKISVALGYNTATFDTNWAGEEDSIMTAANVTYGSRGGKGLYAAVVLVDGENHHLDNTGSFLDESTGVELMAAYRFDNDFEVIGGAINVTTDDAGNDYEKSYLIAGVAYYWSENFRVFSEVKVDDSTDANGQDAPDGDVVGFGARFSF
ncbi:porin [Thalassomonas sp. M1454]|uniref:porin n=1 Tax=Thalassomonas sp. M1454 TaxID=2594477 RepID=UPI00117F1E0F|nr:porin [Thalassomonas sp. M1454]TRX53983.1 porin [Thalassomonas sp. M1454]